MLIAIPNMISQITSPNTFFEVYCFQLYPIINLDYQAVTNTPSLTFFRCPFTFLSFIQSIDNRLNYMLHHPAYLITYGVLQMMYYTICSETNLPYTLFHMRPYVMLYSPYMFYGLPYTINNQNIKKYQCIVVNYLKFPFLRLRRALVSFSAYLLLFCRLCTLIYNFSQCNIDICLIK